MTLCFICSYSSSDIWSSLHTCPPCVRKNACGFHPGRQRYDRKTGRVNQVNRGTTCAKYQGRRAGAASNGQRRSDTAPLAANQQGLSSARAGSGRTPRRPPRGRAGRFRRGSGRPASRRSPSSTCSPAGPARPPASSSRRQKSSTSPPLYRGKQTQPPIGRLPVEEVGPAGEEVVEQRPVGGDDAAVALPDALAVAQRDRRQVLRRAGVADRRVVLALLEALEQGAVAAGEPADAQAGQAVGLGGHVERDRPSRRGRPPA